MCMSKVLLQRSAFQENKKNSNPAQCQKPRKSADHADLYARLTGAITFPVQAKLNVTHSDVNIFEERCPRAYAQ